MDITLSEGTVSGSVTAPASKSYAQRAIAAALLCEGESVLSNMVQCNDTRAALQVAADLGAKISAHEDTYTLHGGLHPRKRQLNIGESGLATRLFTPITALCTETITLTGKGSILKRPISMMEEPLRQLGATVSSQGGYLPIHIRGAIRGGNITVDGSLSSQFITAEKFRHRHQTQRLPAVLHRRRPTLRPDALPHRRRLERRLVPAGRRSHGRSDHGRKPESAVATSRHGHHRRPDPGRGRNHDDGRFGHRPP